MRTVVLSVSDGVDEYQLYDSVCSIPDYFMTDSSANWTHHVGDTTRSVCRRLCSQIFDEECSGFLYRRTNNSCTLSAYTGEWTTNGTERQCDVLSGVEFYRRLRKTSTYIMIGK